MAFDSADGRAVRHAQDRTTDAPANGPAATPVEQRSDPGSSEVSAAYLAVLSQIADSVVEPDSHQDPEDPTRETPEPAADASPDFSPPDRAPNGDGAAAGTGGRVQTHSYAVTDLDGRGVTYSILGPPEAGTVSDNGDGTFSFDPGGDFRGLATGETRDVSFTYQASDGQGGTATATVTVTVTGAGDWPAAAQESIAVPGEAPAISNDASGAPVVDDVPDDGGAADLLEANVADETLPAGDGNGHLEESAAGGDWVDTIHMDGLCGGPDGGGWTIHLDTGEILERNGESLVLSRGAAGVIVLNGSGEIAFEGIERVEWQPSEVA